MKILISHVFGIWNKGDWILLQEIIRLLKEAFPDAVIEGISRDPALQQEVFKDVKWHQRIDTSISSNQILRRVQNLLGLLTILTLSALPNLVKVLSNNQETELLINALENSDLIVMCPGGYWDPTKPSFLSNLVNLYAVTSCQKRQRIVWAPQSVERIENSALERIFSTLLRKSQLVLLREVYSYEYVQSLECLKSEKLSNTLLVPDLAFYYEPDLTALDNSLLPKHLDDISKGFVACTALDWHFPYADDSAHSKQRYIKALAESANFAYEAYGFKTLLVRQIGNSSEGKGDIGILYQIQAMSNGSAVVVEEDLTPDALTSLISKAQYLVGSRMHSNIFALLTGTPVIAVSYQKKTDGIMEMMSLEDYIISINDITPEKLNSLSANVLNNRSSLVAHIRSQVSELKDKRTDTIREIQKVCFS